MVNQEEQNYLNLLEALLEKGDKRDDRTGTGTLSLFGTRLRFSLEDGKIPLLTTKKMGIKGIVEELLFFIRGETQTKKLEEKGINIWKGNTSRSFLDKRGLKNYEEGEMGPMYGKQWRQFSSEEPANIMKTKKCFDPYCDYNHHAPVDQLQNAFNLIKSDPVSRRIMITAYNPQASNLSVLDPCHLFFQFYVQDNKLSCQFYMRSVDTFLGAPYNLASYAILTHMMAKATGLDGAKELIFLGGDTHLYLNHLEQAKEQITRAPYNFPTLKINKEINSIEDMEKLEFKDFEIEEYKCHSAIKADMAI